MTDEEEISTTERLMTTLISKMESMDSDLQMLKAENTQLKATINNPLSLLRKAGFVATMTPLSEDVSVDAFRGDVSSGLLKNDNSIDYSNEEIHQMSWNDIHDMAEQTKTTEVI